MAFLSSHRFLTALISVLVGAGRRQNVWFLLPFVSGSVSDSKRRPGLRSVRRVHGAVASLLLLFLLQEELLQR